MPTAAKPIPEPESEPESSDAGAEGLEAPTSNDVGEQTLTAADREALSKSSNVSLPPEPEGEKAE